jgi:hypothetical protein
MENLSEFFHLFSVFQWNTLPAPPVDYTVMDHWAVCPRYEIGHAHHILIIRST